MALVRTFCLALCALVLLGLSGCSDEPDLPPPTCTAGQPPPPADAQHSGLLKVGEKFTLLVTPMPPSACDRESLKLLSVTAEIDGPDGEPVTGQIQLGAKNAPATLEFTPLRPGPHHILIAFSQVGGIHQFDLQAVVDSSPTAPSVLLNGPCDSLERTQQGLWVCDAKALRGETVEATFGDARVAVAGDVLWVVSPREVRRYVDTGSSLVLTGAVAHSEGAADSLQASPDAVATVHEGSLALHTFSGGQVASAGATPWSLPYGTISSGGGPYGMLLRDGDEFALVSRSEDFVFSHIKVCPYRIVSGRLQRTLAPCYRMEGEVEGVEPRALWTWEPLLVPLNQPPQGVLHRWEWTGGHLVKQGSVSLRGHSRLLRPALGSPSFVPIIYTDQGNTFRPEFTAVALWSAERQAIFFEHLDAQVFIPKASPTFYWGLTIEPDPDGTTRVRLRPPSPIP